MAEQKVYTGKISYINQDKQFATIDYVSDNKTKAVNCKTTASTKEQKAHNYKLGDVVKFQLKLSDRGEKMTAYNIQYRYNAAIDLLVQKAANENRFSGYLKKVKDQYFIKEWDSYILFPLQLSPWELPPAETAENIAINFKLINLDKPNSIKAELFSHNYIPEYRKAILHFQNEMNIDATVYRISPHALYLKIFNGKINVKIPLRNEEDKIKEGDVIPVLITHLTHTRIIVKKFIT